MRYCHQNLYSICQISKMLLRKQIMPMKKYRIIRFQMDFKPSLINLRKFMKISIGANLFEGPWGGGNLFVKNLSEYLLGNGHEVVFDLFSNDIDIILLT